MYQVVLPTVTAFTPRMELNEKDIGVRMDLRNGTELCSTAMGAYEVLQRAIALSSSCMRLISQGC